VQGPTHPRQRTRKPGGDAVRVHRNRHTHRGLVFCEQPWHFGLE
jgi:hypothetical protein